MPVTSMLCHSPLFPATTSMDFQKNLNLLRSDLNTFLFTGMHEHIGKYTLRLVAHFAIPITKSQTRRILRGLWKSKRTAV